MQFRPQLDGCVREGNWLNISLPWEMEAQELWPCYQDVRPGSYFTGTGFAVFNTSGGKSELNVDTRNCPCTFLHSLEISLLLSIVFFKSSNLFFLLLKCSPLKQVVRLTLNCGAISAKWMEPF